tara:strand:+ start:587 stop:1186 length:600 start_codon:yes stop_codon:yes gene_type:complete
MTVAHIIGNGDSHVFYKPAKGLKITCNLPPREIENVYFTTVVDFKMCKAIDEGSVNLDSFQWVMGARPKKWMEMKPDFYVKHAPKIKEFYLTLPPYCSNYTDFNCGHLATHYACNKLMADEVHLYGFDSMFDFNLISTTDFVLPSNRNAENTQRLAFNWRPITEGIFKEFKNTQFFVYHHHNASKFTLPENVEIIVPKK